MSVAAPSSRSTQDAVDFVCRTSRHLSNLTVLVKGHPLQRATKLLWNVAESSLPVLQVNLEIK